MTATPGYLPPPKPGPWFRTLVWLDCSACQAGIGPGEKARADMDGGFLCRACGERYGGLADVDVAGGLL